MRSIAHELAKLYPTQHKMPFDFSNVGFTGSLGSELAVGGWKELARYTSSGSSTLNVSSLPNRRYLMTLTSVPSLSTGATSRIRYNNVVGGTAKSTRLSYNGGADDSTSYINADGMEGKNGSDTETGWFDIGYHVNYSTNEKLNMMWNVAQSTLGASTAPTRQERVSKQVLTNPIDRIEYFLASAGSYSSGCELVVLGYDPADTHTTNFWEELASVTSLTGGNVDSGTFTAKKYLWVQFELIVNAYDSTNVVIQFNADTAGNYANRISQNGGADSTSVSQTSIATTVSGGKRIFGNMFIINNSANEKLVIGHTVVIGTGANSTAEGAGVAPRRLEFVGKWANTSNQITKIVLDDTLAGFVSGQIKVWGSN